MSTIKLTLIIFHLFNANPNIYITLPFLQFFYFFSPLTQTIYLKTNRRLNMSLSWRLNFSGCALFIRIKNTHTNTCREKYHNRNISSWFFSCLKVKNIQKYWWNNINTHTLCLCILVWYRFFVFFLNWCCKRWN